MTRLRSIQVVNMAPNGRLHRQIMLVWLGILVGAGAVALLELLLLERRVGVAVGATAVLAVGTAAMTTRRIISKHRQPLITVRDLRARPRD